MKLDGYEILHCDAGWRKFSFLRLHADDGTTGIAEYNESYGSPGLSAVIEGQLEWIMGANPMATERVSSELYARSRQAHGGITQQASAAIENALLDMKGRKLRCRATNCSVAWCATACGSTGPTAAATDYPTPRLF